MEERSAGPWGFDLTLLRRGEITAAVAALVMLLGLIALPWYSATDQTLAGPDIVGPAPASFGAWSGAGWLGTLGDLVILAAALGALVVAAAGARGIELDGSGRRLFWLSVAALCVVLIRIAFRPTVVSGYHLEAGLRLGIFVTVVGTLVLVWAAWVRRPRPGPLRASAR